MNGTTIGRLRSHSLGTVSATGDVARLQAGQRSRRHTIGNIPLPRNPGKARAGGRRLIGSAPAWKRWLGAVGVAAGTFVYGLLQLADKAATVGTLGIYHAAKRISAAIYRRARGMQTVDPNAQLSFRLPGGGTEVQVRAAILPKRYPSTMTLNDLWNTIQEKINRGHRTLQDVYLGTIKRRCTAEDMTNIMWYLQMKAVAKGLHSAHGAFNIPDPQHRLRDFLDSCEEAYQRKSSHLHGFQGMPGGRHRGIDSYGSARHTDRLLPYGLTTLCYGALQRSKEWEMPNDRIWLKMESHGAWLSRAHGGRDEPGPGRAAQWHDIDAGFGHLFSFLKTRGQGSAFGTFKERIPSDVKNGYRSLLDSVKERFPRIHELLTRGNPLKNAGGIRVMYENARCALEDLGGQINFEGLEDIRNALSLFCEGLRKRFDHLDVRIGNEAVFSTGELVRL